MYTDINKKIPSLEKEHLFRGFVVQPRTFVFYLRNRFLSTLVIGLSTLIIAFLVYIFRKKM